MATSTYSDTLINDKRTINNFQFNTLSNFKRSDVKKEFINALLNSKIEPACFWSAEMICSGYYETLWDLLIFFYSKWIHLGNVKLIHMLSKRFDFFKRVSLHQDSDLILRNNQTIRILFAELICVFCLSKKKNAINSVEIKKESFDLAELKEILKAPSLIYGTHIIRNDDDSTELHIPVNELCYAIQTKNTMQCFYWIEWLLEYETRCFKKKEKIKLGRRDEICKIGKYQKDIVWIIWECLYNEVNNNIKQNKSFFIEVYNSCINLFHLNYNTTRGKKKKFLIFFFCLVVTEPFDMTSNIVDKLQLDIVENVKDNIDKVYKQIKKNEVVEKLEYLNLIPKVKTSSSEKSLKQMEILMNHDMKNIVAPEEETV